MDAKDRGPDLKKEDVERRLVDYILDTRYEDIPKEMVETGKLLALTILGATIAGAGAEGCQAMADMVKEWGGKEEGTIFIYGGKVPAHNAAFVNAIITRARDLVGGMVPGMHVGASTIPSALAAVELAGGCSGKEFLTSLLAAVEVASRINACSTYNGFDPTGVCAIFAVTAAAGRILKLDKEGMLNALAIAFTRSGGSMQSNIDGALTVRGTQGFAASNGIFSVQMAQRGMTGPRNFLKGLYGYFHLYGADTYDPDILVGQWMKNFCFKRENYKKHPSCWATASGTDAMLEIVRESGLKPEDVDHIWVTMTPYAYTLVGHKFEIGDRPTVNAQFSISYCIANALLRRSSKIKHFEEAMVKDPNVLEIINKIDVAVDNDLEETGHNAVLIRIRTKKGESIEKVVPVPRGAPENPLTMEEHMARYYDCVEYGETFIPRERSDLLLSTILKLEKQEDVRDIIPLLLA
jgi:2-methylcitrate dehydratase PrpD